jgi:hypothetical protein
VPVSLYLQAIGCVIFLTMDKDTAVSVGGEPVRAVFLEMMLRRIRGVLSETLFYASINASFALPEFRSPETQSCSRSIG